MILALLLALALAPAPAPATATDATVEDDRLRLCVEQAASDSAGAIAAADRWLAEAAGPARAKPLQCLGHAYTALLRWAAAEDAFVAAAQAVAGSGDPSYLAILWAQAGNAALAGGQPARAVERFDRALAAAPADPAPARGRIAADRARALVAAGRPGEAGEALAAARRDAPDVAEVWLLSATLARRAGDLAEARRLIAIALGLAPGDGEIALEAGVVAVLAGDEDAARERWQAVVRGEPASAAAQTARAYLLQLGDRVPAPVEGR